MTQKFGVVTLFPEMFETLRCGGVVGRALDSGLFTLATWNPRDYATDVHRTVDARPYGGGPGMVMQVAPLREAIRAAKQALGDATRVLYMSPQGRRLEHAVVNELLADDALVLVSGRYEGIDERVIESEIDAEISIGDYVLSGGELPAMVLIDALVRQLPGVLGHEDSAREDSFFDGLLDSPHYTRPKVFEGRAVPAALLSGNHAAIRRWRYRQALGRTWLRRPDLLAAMNLNDEQRMLLVEFIQAHEDGKG